MAEGNAAIHAAHGLVLQFLVREVQVQWLPIVDTFANRSFAGRFSLVF